MTRLSLVQPARPVARKPVYERWPIYACGTSIDRRAQYEARAARPSKPNKTEPGRWRCRRAGTTRRDNGWEG